MIETTEPIFINPAFTKVYVGDESGRQRVCCPFREYGVIPREDSAYFLVGEHYRKYPKLEEFRPEGAEAQKAPEGADTGNEGDSGDNTGEPTGNSPVGGASVTSQPAGIGTPRATGNVLPGELIAFLDGDTNLANELVEAGVTSIEAIAAMDEVAEDADVDLINRAKDYQVKLTLTVGCAVEFDDEDEDSSEMTVVTGTFNGYSIDEDDQSEVADVKVGDDVYSLPLRDLRVPASTE